MSFLFANRYFYFFVVVLFLAPGAPRGPLVRKQLLFLIFTQPIDAIDPTRVTVGHLQSYLVLKQYLVIKIILLYIKCILHIFILVVAHLHILCAAAFTYVQLFVSTKTRFGWQHRDHQQSNDGITRALHQEQLQITPLPTLPSQTSNTKSRAGMICKQPIPNS